MPVINMIKTGEKIKALREEKGYSVKDIQEFFGFATANTIYKWQKGESMPTIDNLLGLSKIFGIKMDDIIVAE